MIRSVRELVDALGGTGETAKFLGIVPSNISNWIAADYIPRGHHLELYLEAQRRGFRVEDTVWPIERRPASQQQIAS